MAVILLKRQPGRAHTADLLASDTAEIPGTLVISGTATAGTEVLRVQGETQIEGVLHGTLNGTGLVIGVAGALASSGSALQIGSFTTTQRGNLTPSAGMEIYNSTLSWFQSYNGTRWGDEARNNNFQATVDPTVSDDSTQGYSVGSLWINKTTRTEWVCMSAAVGAAVWTNQQGPQGAPGLDGTDGEEGQPGKPGLQGLQGIQGLQGNSGNDGIDGEDGQPGPIGLTGSQGIPGQPGPPGADGVDGTDGEPGTQGLTGLQGITGLPGEPGLDGADGEDGTIGPPGIPGIQGIVGIQGVPGADGIDGEDGQAGIPGSQGLQGIQGISGSPGSDGSDGDDGYIGPPGPQGNQGTQGLIGSPGLYGEDGLDGERGPPGATGPQGPAGQIIWLPGEDGNIDEVLIGVPSSFGTGLVTQNNFTEISADTTTTSATYVDLLSATVQVTSGVLLIHFSAAISNSGANNNMVWQLLVDGAATRGGGGRNGATSTQIQYALIYKKTGLSVGSHTVKIQWSTPGGGTMQCRPVTTVNEHASLLVQEVSI